MKKKSRKLLTVLLSLTMIASLMMTESAAFAADRDEDADSEAMMKEIAKQFADRNKDPFAYRKGTKPKKNRSLNTKISQFDLSAKFMEDGDETSYVTPVKFQNPFGSCWGFAAIATAETSIIGDGIAPGYAAQADPDSGTKELDLSEKHLINFVVTPLNDQTSSQNGEGMYYVKKDISLAEKFDMGGLPVYATNLFASGMGPDREDRSVPDGLPEDIFEYKGLEGNIDQRKINGKYEDYSYSDEDDWSMPEDLRFKQSYTLEESYILPSPAKLIEDEEDMFADPEYDYNPDGTEAIKTQLINKRAVEIGFCADNSMPNQEVQTRYISPEWAHYTFEPAGANHAVTIVGWDDEYSVEHFAHKTVLEDENGDAYVGDAPLPPAEGAWLVKNSWGSGERDFPNKGPGSWGIPVDKLDGEGNPVTDGEGNNVQVGSGYFWLSYYDQSISMPEALKFTDAVPTDGYYLDQYDFMPVSEAETADLDKKVSMSNVFKAEENEKLDYFSCVTAAPGTTVEYEIYLLPQKYKDPQDGVKVASGTAGPFEYGGFHKISVARDVVIQKGQYYSIIVTQKTPDDKYNINIQTGTCKEMAENFDSPCWQKGIVNKGESFVNLNGKWYDYSDDNFRDMVFEGLQYLYSIDNFPIKGYCSKVQNLKMYLADGNNLKLPPYEETFGGFTEIAEELILRFKKGAGAKMPAEPVIEWNIVEGSEGIFEMTPNGDDSARVTVKALKPGVGYITVSARGMIDKEGGEPGEQEEILIGTEVIRIEVPKRGWYDVWDIGELSYGESESVFIVNVDGSSIPDGTFKYKSDNPKIATVSAKGVVKGTGVGKTIIRATDAKGVEEQVYVKVIKAEQEPEIKGKTFAIKASKLAKKAKTVKRENVITVKNAKGKVTYVKKKGNKRILVKKGGKVILKKGLKKGMYKVKVRVKADGGKNYKSYSKLVTFRIRVKK